MELHSYLITVRLLETFEINTKHTEELKQSNLQYNNVTVHHDKMCNL